MDGARLRSKVNAGLGKAAKRLGFPYEVYRCRATAFVTDDATRIASAVPAMFTRQLPRGFVFTSPPDAYELYWHGLFDPTGMQVGDYMVGEQGGFYVMGLTPTMQPLCMLTTNVITAYAAAPASTGAACGVGAYSAITQDNRAVALSGWPCVLSLTSGGRGGRGLPLSGGEDQFDCFLPDVEMLHLTKGMIVSDNVGVRYVVEATDTSPFGWRSILRSQVV